MERPCFPVGESRGCTLHDNMTLKSCWECCVSVETWGALSRGTSLEGGLHCSPVGEDWAETSSFRGHHALLALVQGLSWVLVGVWPHWLASLSIPPTCPIYQVPQDWGPAVAQLLVPLSMYFPFLRANAYGWASSTCPVPAKGSHSIL